MTATSPTNLIPPTIVLCHPFEPKCLCFVPDGMEWASRWPDRSVHLYFADCTLGWLVDQAFALWDLHIFGRECRFWREICTNPISAKLQDSIEGLIFLDRQEQPPGLNLLVLWSTPDIEEEYKVGNYSGGWSGDPTVVYHHGFPPGHYLRCLPLTHPWRHHDGDHAQRFSEHYHEVHQQEMTAVRNRYSSWLPDFPPPRTPWYSRP